MFFRSIFKWNNIFKIKFYRKILATLCTFLGKIWTRAKNSIWQFYFRCHNMQASYHLNLYIFFKNTVMYVIISRYISVIIRYLDFSDFYDNLDGSSFHWHVMKWSMFTLSGKILQNRASMIWDVNSKNT